MTATTIVRERPILFSAPMILAILAGTKSQTRRVMKPQPSHEFLKRGLVEAVPQWPQQDGVRFFMADGMSELVKSKHGAPGDRLWVRETFAPRGVAVQPDGRRCAVIEYRADNERIVVPHESAQRMVGDWKPSIFMPRWASRITLEIVDVRVERVNDISPDDCRAEGMPKDNTDTGVRYCYGQLWNQLNEARGYGWNANPWVFAITFKRITP